MSKAFTKDDDSAGELLVVPRAPLPLGLPNYVTPHGLAALHAERDELERERAKYDGAAERLAELRAVSQRLAQVQARIASAEVVDPSAQPHTEVRFGARVRVVSAAGAEHEYEIVGVDEADPRVGKIAFSAPLARALLGKRIGDAAEVRTPRAIEDLEVVGITYGEP